jgi:uncharacterized peroxidase-related enzyme
MAHIETGNRYPGILSLLYFKPSTGAALSGFAEALLRGPSGLTRGERELIATYVSQLNGCGFCHDSHAAAASALLEGGTKIPRLSDGGFSLGQSERENQSDRAEDARLSSKMRALLHISAQVQKSGKAVLPEDIANAKRAGASDEDIHDTVLVAAAFCMFNRYVDGLGTAPAAPEVYPKMGLRLARQGYRYPPRGLRWLVRRILDRQFGRPEALSSRSARPPGSGGAK